MGLMNKKAIEAIRNKENWKTETEDDPICAICKERVVNDVPLRLFNLKDNTAISFHIDCGTGEAS